MLEMTALGSRRVLFGIDVFKAQRAFERLPHRLWDCIARGIATEDEVSGRLKKRKKQKLKSLRADDAQPWRLIAALAAGVSQLVLRFEMVIEGDSSV